MCSCVYQVQVCQHKTFTQVGRNFIVRPLKVLALHTVKSCTPTNSVAQPIRYKLTFSGNNMILIHCALTVGTQLTDIGDKKFNENYIDRLLMQERLRE